jgi:hypothetical protein
MVWGSRIKARAKRFVEAVPLLHAAVLLLHRAWRERGAWGALVADYLKTRHETAFLRSFNVAPIEKTLSVFALDDDNIYNLKLFAFISQALRLRGWTIQVIFRNRSMLLGKAYFRAFGIDRFIYLSDIQLSDDERTYCQKRADQMLSQPLGLQRVKKWHFEECWIGPQIISTLSRLRFEGMVDFSDPLVFMRLKEMLMPCLEHVLRARKFMKTNPAALGLTIEANYAVFGPLVDSAIAEGAPVIQMIQPWKDDGLIFRRLTSSTRREHPSSVSIKTLNERVRHPWTDVKEKALKQLFADRYGGRWFLQARNQQNTRAYTRDELIARFSLNPEKPIAVVFSQILWDANLFYGDDIFEDYGAWFVETVRAACANNAVNWLIKIHPANVWKRAYENVTREYAETALIRQEIGDLPPHVKIIPADDDISTLSLFENIDFGVTVRGTSGMEIACFGKYCVTAGTGRYSGLGFTLDCADKAKYFERLAHLQEVQPMTTEETARAKEHAYTAFMLRPWLMRSARAEFAYKKVGHHALDHNLHILAMSLEDLAARGDLNDWADWAEGGAVDYLSFDTGKSA